MSVSKEESTYYNRKYGQMITDYMARHPDKHRHYIGIKRDESGDFIWHPDEPAVEGRPKCPMCGRRMSEGTFVGIDLLGYPYWWCDTKACRSALLSRIMREMGDYRSGEGFEQEQRRRCEIMHIPAGYTHMTLDSYRGTDTSEIKRHAVVGDSFFITGRTGTGKTHLAVGILRHLCEENPGEGRYVNVPQLLTELTSRIRSDGDYTQIIRAVSATRYLVLDDLGADKPTDHVRATLYQIVNGRIMENLQTIVTSNLSIPEIGDNYEERLASRLNSHFLITTAGTDKRRERTAV